MLCQAVDDCTRQAPIVLTFASPHDRNIATPADQVWICEYHAQMCMEILGSMGHTIDIDLRKPKSIFGALADIPDWRRWRKRKPHDNTE